jgi:flagellar assembly protein FliH
MKMSPARIWTETESEFVAPVPVWAKPDETRHFTPWTNMAAAEERPTQDVPPVSEILDPEMIRLQAYAEGLAEGRRTVEAEVAAERDAVARLAEVLENLRPEPPRELGLLLAETVKRLVRQIVGEVEIDGEALLARAHAAAEVVADETGPVRMRLHPEDRERLRDARIDVELVADSQLAPGTVVLETGDGWLEDGPQVRLDKLRAALDRLGVPQ